MIIMIAYRIRQVVCKALEAHCACSESLAKFMPRYFVYMSAQGLLLAGKISGIKCMYATRDKCDNSFLARNLSNSHYPWRSFDSSRNLKFAVRVKQIRTTRPS